MGSTQNNTQTLDAKGLKLAILAARYNPKIMEGLLSGALGELKNLGLAEAEITVFRVPGAFELPYLAKKLASSGNWDGLICLGTVIQGETKHFDYVCEGVTQGIMQAMLETLTPIAFGILTTDNESQAEARSSNDEHNKGREAARTVVEMVKLGQSIDKTAKA